MGYASILFLLAVLPVIIICRYIYCQDRNKEPIRLLLYFFLLGVVSCFLVLGISFVLSIIFPFFAKEVSHMNFVEVFFMTFFGIALIEEFCKWLFVYMVGYSNREFDEVYDIMVYAIFVSLGFAFVENLSYIFLEGTISVGIMRGLLSVPAHACDAISMGYYLSLAKLYARANRKDLERSNILKSIFVPTLLHGIYDFCLLVRIPLFLIVFIIFVFLLYRYSLSKVREVSGSVKKVSYRNHFCPQCGNPVDSLFCSVCGRRQE